MSRPTHYRWRVIYRNKSGVVYSPTHHATREATERRAASFLSPSSTLSCAPRRGYPFNSTACVIQERTENGGWIDTLTLTY